jgi:hypothetical protein
LHPLAFETQEVSPLTDISSHQISFRAALPGEHWQHWEKLARRTGGTAVLYSPHRNVLDRVERDSRSYYSLAFSPQWQADGRQHRIAVAGRLF